MGRFDALTQLEIDKKPLSKPERPQVDKPAKPQTILPTNLQTRKTANHLAFKIDDEKPEKYTTRLKPSMVRRVKVFAAQQDSKDYDVVEKALTEYFERNK